MGPSGHELQLQQRPEGEPFADAVARDGLPAVGHDGHPQPVAGIATDGRLHPADLGGDRAAHEGEVALVDPARLELRLERHLGGVRAGHHEQAARVPVEPVDDARPLDAPDRAQGAAVLGGHAQECVDEGAGVVSGGGMRHEARPACPR